MKRKLKIKSIYECRCDGRLQTKRFTRLSYTGLVVELEHCHGDMGRGTLARAYASREGDMSWGQLVPVLTDNL
jgi:hypothetical protein